MKVLLQCLMRPFRAESIFGGHALETEGGLATTVVQLPTKIHCSARAQP